jgi:hypothetical protein
VEFKSDPIYLSIHPSIQQVREGHRHHHRANAKSKYLPQKSVTGKQKKKRLIYAAISIDVSKPWQN